MGRVEENYTSLDLIGTLELQGALLRGLLELLMSRGLINDLEETDLFNMARMLLSTTPRNEARDYALQKLNDWRDSGLLHWCVAPTSRRAS